MSRLNLEKLPNQKLVKTLYENYYIKTGGDQANNVSSHWEYHSQKFNVHIDRGSNCLDFTAIGFGHSPSANILQKTLNYIGHISYWLRLADKMGNLKLMSPSHIVCKKMGIPFSFDCFKQVYSLNLIKKYMPDRMKKKDRLIFLIIGDGYGFLASLIKEVFPNSTVILIDIGRALLFQAAYCQKAHPESLHSGIHEVFDLKVIDFLYCPAEDLEKLNVYKIDIAVNIASMQEMNQKTVQRYFSFLRQNCNKENIFYCCNREFKKLIGGEILEFKKYPWSKEDQDWVNELCPWYKYFLSFHSFSHGAKIFDFRIPFVNYFDGPMWHRMTTLTISI